MTTRTWDHEPTCKWTDEGQLDITGFPEDMPMCLQFYLTSIRPEKWPRALKLIQQGEGHCFANEIGILFPLDYESSSSEEDQPSKGPIPEDEVEFFAGYFPKDRVKKSVFLRIVEKCLEERNKTFRPFDCQDEFLDYVRSETRSKDHGLPELGSTGIKRTTSVDSLESIKVFLKRITIVNPFLDSLDLATDITQEDTSFTDWVTNPDTKKQALICRRLDLRQELDTERLKGLESKLEITENRFEIQGRVVQGLQKLVTGLQQEQETVQKVLLDEKTKNEELTEAIKSMETTINDLLDQKTKLTNKLAMVESEERALTKAPEEPGRSTQVKSVKADFGGDVHTTMALSKPSSPDPVYTPGTARGAKLAEGEESLKEGEESLKEGQDSLKEGEDSLKEGQDSLKEGEDSLKEGQDSLKEGEDSLKEGQDSLKEAQDGMEEGKDGLKEGQGSLKKGQESLKEGQDSLKKGHDGLTEGQDSLKERQGNLKEGQDSLNEGQDSMEGGQDGLKEAQDGLKEGHILEHVLTNQSQGMSTKPRAESSHQMDQLNAGSTDLVDDVIASLKDLYATEYAHVRPLPWCEDLSLPLGDVYTNLQLQYREGRGRFQDTGTIVSLVDIYDTREGEVSVNSAVRKVRVEGGPGIGKSCSCQKLAYDWSCGKRNRFKVVFFLEMRHIAGKVKDEIFEQLLPPDTKTTPDQLWSYIQENQDDVLFILDGLDELSQAAREVTDVVDLIQGKILRNCHVLVTSRPYHCVKDLEKCDQFYKILGYSKKDSEEFIHKYFCKSPESGLELVKQLKINRSLSEIVVNPLNNVLICVVFEDNNKKLPSSKDELYRDIVHSVAKRFCTKNYIQMEGDKLPPHIEEALRGLGKLSWEGLEQETLQFNIDEIREKYGTTADNMLNMGLLTRDYSFSRIKRTCYCAFLHITFQEYMAACYISGLIMGGSSKDEGMECVCRLFGMSNAAVVNRELVMSCQRKYREVQNWLLLILGENSRPIFERFAEELKKGQTDKDMEAFSFFVIMWLGTTCAGGELAEIVAPYLSHLATNDLSAFGSLYFLLDDTTVEGSKMAGLEMDVPDRLSRLGTINQRRQDDQNWFVGLAHVLASQKKLSLNDGASFIQHLDINCNDIDDAMRQETLAALENTLSDYDNLRSVTLCEIGFDIPLQTFIPRCGIEHVVICNNNHHITHLSLSSTLEHLSSVSTIEHVEVTARKVLCDPGERDVDFTEYDGQLANMIASQSRLRFLKFEIDSWERKNPKTKGFPLTATLQSISEHSRLEVVEFNLPGNDSFGFVRFQSDSNNVMSGHETFIVEPMVHTLTECVKNNKVLKTLVLRWRIDEGLLITCKIYHGDCSDQSLSSLCSAIRENRTLETLVVEGMLSHSECRKEMISELLRNKPSNYKELSITLSDRTSPHDQA